MSISCEISLTRLLIVNFVPGNVLVPSANEPLPEPMLTKIYVAM